MERVTVFRIGFQARAVVAAIAIACGTAGAAATARPAAVQTTALTIDLSKPGPAVSPMLFGLFFEDINFGADGGLYPERVKNHSFEFPEPMMGWKPFDAGETKGALLVLDRGSVERAPNSHYLRIKVEQAGKGYGVVNEGFRGIGVRGGAEYTVTVDARRVDGDPARLRFELIGASGQSLGHTEISGFELEWKTYTGSIRATATDPKAHLRVLMVGRGTLDVDSISVFPVDTWKNRRNGMRPDLVKLLSEMKPTFLRFPGGCIVEGSNLERRYQWKTTVGERDERRLLVNRWNDVFHHRLTPDYYQSFGLGFYEYFQLSEDIGAEPMPIINCGMACQFNTSELVPLEQLDHYIQDALDLIEFANGPPTSGWGKLRAEMGHPEPFDLKMLGVGNEQWGPQYVERYEAFAKALEAKHPEILLITSAGPAPDGERFDYLWTKMRELGADIVDEHYYMPPEWFPANATRYDDYPRTGPKVFAGEYAAQSVGIASPENRNTWRCALSEAAFVTGLERNADVVVMSSYAPLFGHVDAWQWTPNMIWFDNLRSYGTPNYYVQKLFSVNQGTTILPVTIDGSAKNGTSSLFASAMRDDRTGEVILKVVNTTSSPRELRVDVAGSSGLSKTGTAFELASEDLDAENSLDEPTKVAPVERQFAVAGNEIVYRVPPTSLVVLRVGAAKR